MKIHQLLIKKKKVIGQGASSVAYKVTNIYSNKGFLCLKVLKDELLRQANGPITKKSTIKSLLSEEEDENEEVEDPQIDMKKAQMLYYELLSQLFHPNIVDVYRFYFGDKSHNPAILLEFCASNFGVVIEELTNAELVGIICEICSAIYGEIFPKKKNKPFKFYSNFSPNLLWFRNNSPHFPKWGNRNIFSLLLTV